MGMNRRSFFGSLAALFAFHCADQRRMAAQTTARRCTEAAPARQYPGPVRPVRCVEIRQVARWGG